MTKKKPVLEKVDKQIIIAAIASLTILMGIALFLGFDGTLLRLVMAIIAGAAGFAIPADKIMSFIKKK